MIHLRGRWKNEKVIFGNLHLIIFLGSMIMKIKLWIISYTGFLFASFIGCFIYLSSIANDAPVSEFLSITGPMPLIYLIFSLGWFLPYSLLTLIAIIVTGLLWFLALNSSGGKRIISLVFGLVAWLFFGMLSLAMSYYG